MNTKLISIFEQENVSLNKEILDFPILVYDSAENIRPVVSYTYDVHEISFLLEDSIELNNGSRTHTITVGRE